MSSENPRSERGILSEADRDVLFGTSNISDGAKYNRRAAIRKRVVNGLLDFHLLFRHLNDRDRKKIADEIGMDEFADVHTRGSTLMSAAPLAITQSIAFLYLLHRDIADAENATEAFQETVGEGVGTALTKELGGRWRADVDIDPERVPTRAEIERKLSEGRTADLTGAEAQWVVLALDKEGFFDRFDMRDTPQELRAIQNENWRGVEQGKLTADRYDRLLREGVEGVAGIDLVENQPRPGPDTDDGEEIDPATLTKNGNEDDE